jgi:hypothetical protein
VNRSCEEEQTPKMRKKQRRMGGCLEGLDKSIRMFMANKSKKLKKAKPKKVGVDSQVGLSRSRSRRDILVSVTSSQPLRIPSGVLLESTGNTMKAKYGRRESKAISRKRVDTERPKSSKSKHTMAVCKLSSTKSHRDIVPCQSVNVKSLLGTQEYGFLASSLKFARSGKLLNTGGLRVGVFGESYGVHESGRKKRKVSPSPPAPLLSSCQQRVGTVSQLRPTQDQSMFLSKKRVKGGQAMMLQHKAVPKQRMGQQLRLTTSPIKQEQMSGQMTRSPRDHQSTVLVKHRLKS